jgi:hypothetical protein
VIDTGINVSCALLFLMVLIVVNKQKKGSTFAFICFLVIVLGFVDKEPIDQIEEVLSVVYF